MKNSFGKLLRAAALTTLWSVAGTSIAPKADAQTFNPKYNGTMTVLKEIEENCNLSDAALAQSMLTHFNDFLKEAEAKGIQDIEKEPLRIDHFHPQLLASLRKWGFVDLDIGAGPEVKKGPRFVCQIS